MTLNIALSGGKVQEAKNNGDIQQLMAFAQNDMDSISRLSGVTPENRETSSDAISASRATAGGSRLIADH